MNEWSSIPVKKRSATKSQSKVAQVDPMLSSWNIETPNLTATRKKTGKKSAKKVSKEESSSDSDIDMSLLSRLKGVTISTTPQPIQAPINPTPTLLSYDDHDDDTLQIVDPSLASASTTPLSKLPIFQPNAHLYCREVANYVRNTLTNIHMYDMTIALINLRTCLSLIFVQCITNGSVYVDEHSLIHLNMSRLEYVFGAYIPEYLSN